MQAVRIEMVGLIRVAIGVYVSLNNITVNRTLVGVLGLSITRSWHHGNAVGDIIPTKHQPP